MKSIIRIEHPEDGYGIFCTRWEQTTRSTGIVSTFSYNSEDIGDIDDRHSNMIGAGLIDGFTEDHFCAYPSLTKMKRWINNKEVKQLLSLGFEVLLLDVSEYILDEEKNQAIYKKEHIVNKKNISTLFL